MLKAGYIDLGEFVENKEKGTPQGSVLSPLLCNIFMHQLDLKMQELMDKYNDPSIKKGRNPIHTKLNREMKKAFKEGRLKDAFNLRR